MGRKLIMKNNPGVNMLSTHPKTHIVKEGETLYIIAQEYEITLEALKDANPGIDPELIVVGQEINIPDQESGEDLSAQTHIVKKGETLAKIAQEYKVTLEDLKAANLDINPDLLVVGQRITIPDGD